MDLIRELGEMALASRLRAFSDLLMQEASELYGELGIEFEARWFGIVQALLHQPRRGITELSQDLGLSHPAIRKTADQLIKRGLVRESRDTRDERRRLLSLTPKGRRMAKRLAPVWAAFRDASRETLSEAGVDLLGDLARVEEVVSDRSVAARVREKLGLPSRPTVRFVDYRPAYKKHFRALNEERLKRHFTVETSDTRLLEDPNGRIIKKGGAILFALERDQVVGTCALVRHPGDLFELTKMAVAPEARRRGIGLSLAQAVIERARQLGAREVYLQTSPRLKAAQSLYRSLGFLRIRNNPLPRADYRRGGTVYRLVLPQDHPADREKEK